MMRTVHWHLGRYKPKENNLLTFVKLACWRMQGHFFLSGMKICTEISFGPIHTRSVVALFPSPLCSDEHVRRVGTFYHRSAVVTFDSHDVQSGGQGSRLSVTVWRTRCVTFDSHDVQYGGQEGRSWREDLSGHLCIRTCVRFDSKRRFFLSYVLSFFLF